MQNNFTKIAVTYRDMVGLMRRFKKNPNIMDGDITEYLPESKKKEIMDRLPEGYTILPKLGPMHMNKDKLNTMAPKELQGKSFMSNWDIPEPTKSMLIGNKQMGPKTKVTAQAFMGIHEHTGEGRAMFRDGNRFGHNSIGLTIGRADNNFVASAKDAPTKEVAKIISGARNQLGEAKAFENLNPRKSSMGTSPDTFRNSRVGNIKISKTGNTGMKRLALAEHDIRATNR